MNWMSHNSNANNALLSSVTKAHLSEDEDYQIEPHRLKNGTLCNNYYAQKLITSNDEDKSTLLVRDAQTASTGYLKPALEKKLLELRKQHIFSKLESEESLIKQKSLNRRIKYHSLESNRDKDYYYSTNYNDLLSGAQRIVFQKHYHR